MSVDLLSTDTITLLPTSGSCSSGTSFADLYSMGRNRDSEDLNNTEGGDDKGRRR
jgi:hypothetical protein